MVSSRVCECGEGTIYFKTEDAGKFMMCDFCKREYEIFYEVSEEDETLYELTAEPTQALLME